MGYLVGCFASHKQAKCPLGEVEAEWILYNTTSIVGLEEHGRSHVDANIWWNVFQCSKLRERVLLLLQKPRNEHSPSIRFEPTLLRAHHYSLFIHRIHHTATIIHQSYIVFRDSSREAFSLSSTATCDGARAKASSIDELHRTTPPYLSW